MEHLYTQTAIQSNQNITFASWGGALICLKPLKYIYIKQVGYSGRENDVFGHHLVTWFCVKTGEQVILTSLMHATLLHLKVRAFVCSPLSAVSHHPTLFHKS